MLAPRVGGNKGRLAGFGGIQPGAFLFRRCLSSKPASHKWGGCCAFNLDRPRILSDVAQHSSTSPSETNPRHYEDSNATPVPHVASSSRLLRCGQATGPV